MSQLKYPCHYRRQGYLVYLENEEQLQNFGGAFAKEKEYDYPSPQSHREICKVVNEQDKLFRQRVKEHERLEREKAFDRKMKLAQKKKKQLT